MIAVTPGLTFGQGMVRFRNEFRFGAVSNEDEQTEMGYHSLLTTHGLPLIRDFLAA